MHICIQIKYTHTFYISLYVYITYITYIYMYSPIHDIKPHRYILFIHYIYIYIHAHIYIIYTYI